MQLSDANFNELSFDNSVKLVFSFEDEVSMGELLKSAIFGCIKSDAKKITFAFAFILTAHQ